MRNEGHSGVFVSLSPHYTVQEVRDFIQNPSEGTGLVGKWVHRLVNMEQKALDNNLEIRKQLDCPGGVVAKLIGVEIPETEQAEVAALEIQLKDIRNRILEGLYQDRTVRETKKITAQDLTQSSQLMGPHGNVPYQLGQEICVERLHVLRELSFPSLLGP